MTASGTAGHAAELAPYGKLAHLGAVVVKSLHAEPWQGNPAPRLAPLESGMINSVGLQGPGIESWLDNDLPNLLAEAATVVASIWGHTVTEFARAAEMLAAAPADVVAVEVNLSCPNTDAGRHTFASDPDATKAVMEATAACNRPRWAKLSPMVANICDIAAAAINGGAEALVLTNTMPGIRINTSNISASPSPDDDAKTRSFSPVLGAGGGGVSGAALHPVALRVVHDVHTAMPEVPIIGVGGISIGEHAAEFILAGACAVQVGTATFADPRAVWKVQKQLQRWFNRHAITDISHAIGALQ